MFGGTSIIMSLMKVEDIMSRNVITVPASTTIGATREILRARDIHHLIIAEQHHVLGVISLIDLAKAADDRPVSEVMRRDLASVEPTASVREAAERMNGNGVGCLPVVENGALCGIVTTADLLRAVSR